MAAFQKTCDRSTVRFWRQNKFGKCIPKYISNTEKQNVRQAGILFQIGHVASPTRMAIVPF